MEVSPDAEGAATKDKCPTCGEGIPADATDCPACGEALVQPSEEKKGEPEKKTNWLFWIGLLLVFLGGPGIAVGSWLHDLLKINFPAGYDAWSVFGWVNRLVSAVGIVVLLVGMLVLAISILRGRPAPEEEEM